MFNQYESLTPIKADDLKLFFTILYKSSHDYLSLDIKDEDLSNETLDKLMLILENIRKSSDTLQMRIIAKNGF